MASSTVNISDFRCRGIKPAYQCIRAESNSTKLVVAEAEPKAAHREAELAVISQNPSVFDIGIAREAQRMRQRLVFRPIAMHRHRANVIRFGEPGVTVMQPQGSSERVHRTSASQDRDFPPAA
jgi:hypothetical protein